MTHSRSMGENGDFVQDAYCGLCCGGCSNFQATREGRELEMAALAGQPVQAITCQGCKTDTVAAWCAECGIRACAGKKGIGYCIECADFPCADWKAFETDPKYVYHLEALPNMKAIKARGLAAWLKEQDRRWRCPSCGERISWWDKACKACGAALP